MYFVIVLSALLLLTNVHAQPTSSGQFTKSADGQSASGTVIVSGLSFSPCTTTNFSFGSNIPSNLADNNPNVALTLSYTYQASSSQQLLITSGINMGLVLTYGYSTAMDVKTVNFSPTSGSASMTTITLPSVARFDSISMQQMSITNGVDKCDAQAASAPGIIGYAPIVLQLTIKIGGDATGSTTADSGAISGQGVVIAYSQGVYQNGFKDFPWGKQTYTLKSTEIDWMPCEYIGLTFYSISKKYYAKSLTGLRLTLQTAQDVTLQVRLHNVGQDKDVYSSLIAIKASTGFQQMVFPISGMASTTKFDQILIAENQGVLCSTNPAHVHVQEVALVGTVDLPTSYVPSVNGVEQSTDSSQSSQGSTKGKSSNDSDSLVSVYKLMIGLMICIITAYLIV